MIASTAFMVLAIYWRPDHFPATTVFSPNTIRNTEAEQRMTESPVNAQQQRQGDGTVEDRNDADRTPTGLLPDPQAGDRVVLPHQK